MTDITDSTAVVSPNGTPSPVGGAQGVQPNSLDVDALVTKLRESLLPEIETRVERAFQSGKDRRFSKFEKQLDEVRQKLTNDLVSEGVAPEEAAQVVAQRLPKPQTPQVASDSAKPDAVGNPSPLAELQRNILQEAGIAESDPDVLAYRQRTYANDTASLADLSKLVARRLNPKPVSAAAVPTPTSHGEGNQIGAIKDPALLLSLGLNQKR